MTRYGLFAVIICILVVLLIIMSGNNKNQIIRINNLETEMQRQFDSHANILIEAWQNIAQTAAASVIEEIEAASEATGGLFAASDARTRRFDSMYSNLLTQLEKSSTESQPDRLYTQSVLIDLEKEAMALFNDGKYARSLLLYETISEVQPENAQARFYYLYSLFLNNKFDRTNYTLIKEGLQILERHGYLRAEITEVLEYIRLEESGFEAEDI